MIDYSAITEIMKGNKLSRTADTLYCSHERCTKRLIETLNIMTSDGNIVVCFKLQETSVQFLFSKKYSYKELLFRQHTVYR